MRVVSEEAIQQVEQMEAALNHTAEMVNNLRQRLEDFQYLGQAEQEILTDESALSRKKLSGLEGAIPVLIRRVTQQQGAFAQSVEEVLASVQFPVTVAEASSRSIGFFRNMMAWGSEGGSRFVVDTAVSQKIDLLKSNYTMESERHTHTAVLQPVLVPANAAASEPLIELFGEMESPLPAVAGSLGEIAPQRERSEDQRCPVDLLTSETTPPAHSLASKKTTDSEGLGDNVELF